MNEKGGPPVVRADPPVCYCDYLLELPLLPLLLGLELLPAPLDELPPLLLGLELELLLPLGLVGVLVLLGLELLELPLAPLAPLLELDLLKYASHSDFDTCPSLFVSTVVKLGAELEAPLELLPLDMPELPLEELPPDEDELGEELDELGVELDELPPLEAPEEPLLPLALGEDDDDDLSLLEAPVEDEPELWAIDTLASANSAAAVAVVINFNFIWTFLLHEESGGLGDCGAIPCNTCA
jgi:hypothetical protein